MPALASPLLRRPRHEGARRLTGIVAVGLALVLALPDVKPESSVAHAREVGKAVAQRKRRPPTCKADEAHITVGRRVICRKAPTPVPEGDLQLALLGAVVRRDLRLASRGRRIKPLWRGPLKDVRARLLQALPKALALGQVARASRNVAGDRTACRDLASRPAQSDSFDGFDVSVGGTGDVTMTVSVPGGYRLEVMIPTATACSDLELPACPDADGVLAGSDTRRSVLGLRVTKDGALVQSVQTTVTSTQKLRGEVADDAKLDTVSLEDMTQERTRVEVPGATLTFTLSVLRTAELDMRSGATRNAQVRVGVGGLSARDAARTADAYAQSFPNLIREERDNYIRRESLWQTPGTCAKLIFDPASDALRLREGQGGQVTGTVEANAGGVAANAKWTLTAQANGSFTPGTAEAPVSPFHYTVTRAGPDVRVTASFRATSTAGVAEATWSQPTEGDIVYRIDAITYSASHSGSMSGASLPCSTSGSMSESLTVGPLPFDRNTARLSSLDGGYQGFIASGPEPLMATRTGSLDGCDISVLDGPPPACTTTVGASFPVGFLITIEIAPGAATAKLTWGLPGIYVTDGGPGYPCYVTAIVALPLPDERTEPAATFLSPGTHTVSVTRNTVLSTNQGGLTQSVNGTTTASITFHRVDVGAQAR